MDNRFMFNGFLDLGIKIGLVVLIILFMILFLRLIKEKNLYLKQILEEIRELNTKNKN
ncbi:MAG: hypothetical protein ABS939_00555 [Psychrobacillus sp.]